MCAPASWWLLTTIATSVSASSSSSAACRPAALCASDTLRVPAPLSDTLLPRLNIPAPLPPPPPPPLDSASRMLRLRVMPTSAGPRSVVCVRVGFTRPPPPPKQQQQQ